MDGRTPAGGRIPSSEPLLDEQVLSVLLREKSKTLAHMNLTVEREWPALMASYLARCRLTPLPAMAMYTILSDFASQTLEAAGRRRVAIDMRDALPGLHAGDGYDRICDEFQRIVDVLRSAVIWPRTAWELPRIAAYIDEACIPHLSCAALARHTGWKPLALLRAFKRHAGMTIHEYQTRARVHRAAALLAAGEKVEWVMLQVGYRNHTHFNREFRRFAGCAPGEFKRGCLGLPERVGNEMSSYGDREAVLRDDTLTLSNIACDSSGIRRD
jgi:AraC-like DNA-binding protein